MQQTRFRFETANVAEPEALTGPMQRMAWMLFQLFEKREVTYRNYRTQFSTGVKTFSRDFARVAEIGQTQGFRVDKSRTGTIRLVTGTRSIGSQDAGAAMHDSLQAVYRALGDIVLREAERGRDFEEPFLTLAAPKLVSDTQVADVYVKLRAAFRTKARVRFKYPRSGEYGAGAFMEERTVEPHLVTYYAGRYYLVAFDRSPKTRQWRQFALDRIAGNIALSGSCERRVVPEHYRGDDAIGLFKTGPALDVTIALSERIAGAVEARRWQRAQTFVRHGDGSASITFSMHDVGEAVRWALSFSPEAHVISPPEAVAVERRFIEQLGARHTTRTSRSA